MSRYILLISLAVAALAGCTSGDLLGPGPSPNQPAAPTSHVRALIGVCGDGFCEPGESAQSCPADCAGADAGSIVVTTDAFQVDVLPLDIFPSDTGRSGGTPGCVATSGPKCNGCVCEACVCAMDPFCCSTSWDDTCVGECATKCNGNCGGTIACGNGKCEAGETAASCPADCSATASNGCAESNKPGCSGCSCEKCVCAMDSFCCASSWDSQCVAECTGQCNGTCAAPTCGDGKCDAGENNTTCPKDCGQLVPCVQAQCGLAALSCQNSTGCQDYLLCRALCGTNTACAAKCQASALPADLATFQALQHCVGAVCLPEAATCTQNDNTCNGTTLSACAADTGKLVTSTCSDQACAGLGAGPLIGCQKNQAGVFGCVCQIPRRGVCTPAQNSCNGNVLTSCDPSTGLLSTKTCTDQVCKDMGLAVLDKCGIGFQGFAMCLCLGR